MASIYDWSTTAGNNSSADSGINWAEGQDPGSVNDSARQVMGRVAEILGDLGGALSAGGTANGLTVTANSAFTVLAEGRMISFRATASNTGAATLNVNGIGARSIRKMDSTGDVAIVANDIRITGVYVAQYSGALNGAAGGWLLINPTLSAALYSLSGLVTVDNTVPRFNGIAGAIQTSGVVIDDSNNVTGVAALTAATVNATTLNVTGAFTSLGINDDATAQRLQLSNTEMVVGSTTADTDFTIRMANTNSPTFSIVGDTAKTNGGAYIELNANGGGLSRILILGTSNTERFRIDASGDITIAQGVTVAGNVGAANLTAGTYNGGGASAGVFVAGTGVINLSSTGVGSHQKMGFVNGNGGVGSIVTLASATTYNTASDGRKKTNLRDFDAGAIIDALEAWHYDWKTGGTGYGVIAQDALKVFPDAISEDHDGFLLADYSKFVPVLLREVKELRKRVAEMEA